MAATRAGGNFFGALKDEDFFYPGDHRKVFTPMGVQGWR